MNNESIAAALISGVFEIKIILAIRILFKKKKVMNPTGRNGLQGNQNPQPRKQWGAPEVFDLSSLPLALYLIFCSFCRVVSFA